MPFSLHSYARVVHFYSAMWPVFSPPLTDGAIKIEAVSTARLRGPLDRTADFMKLTKNDDLPSSARPPADVVEDMLALNLPLLRLAGMTGNPVFDADWRLIDTPGYQPRPASSSSRTAAHVPSVPEHPSTRDLQRARTLLLEECLDDFPFVDDSSWTHAVAAPLPRVVRGQIDGPTPLTAVDAPTARSGKGLLVECIGVTGTGSSVADQISLNGFREALVVNMATRARAWSIWSAGARST